MSEFNKCPQCQTYYLTPHFNGVQQYTTCVCGYDSRNEPSTFTSGTRPTFIVAEDKAEQFLSQALNETVQKRMEKRVVKLHKTIKEIER